MKSQSLIPIKIVLTGGGSGGHITPILSVAQEIKRSNSHIQLIYIGQKNDNLVNTILDSNLIDEFYSIRAGKWRRYHGESFWSHLKDYKTVLLNIKDIFNLIIGIKQAWFLLYRIKPSVIFIKGGFVGLPVGISAKIRGIEFVTHDSDAIPGLTNRIIGRWAKFNAVGMPAKLYSYPKDKIIYSGIPISEEFKFISQSAKGKYKTDMGLKSEDEVLFVVGGGLGAQRLNNAMLDIAKTLLASRVNLHIIHVTGKSNYEAVSDIYKSNLSPELAQKVRVIGFTKVLYKYSASADVVIMRAGATNLAEMSLQAKACILVPNPQLTGGHQLKNVKLWSTTGATLVYDETQPASQLEERIVKLLNDSQLRTELEKKIHEFAKPSASKDIAALLMDISGA